VPVPFSVLKNALCVCVVPQFSFFSAYCPQLSALEILFIELQQRLDVLSARIGRDTKMVVLWSRVRRVHADVSAEYVKNG